MLTVKGLAMKYIIDFINNCDQGVIDDVKKSCDPDIQELMDKPVNVIQDYDYRFLAQVLNGFYINQPLEEFEKLSVDSADRQMKGFWGKMFKLAGVKFYINKAEFVWKKMFSEGDVKVDERNDGWDITFSGVKLHKAHVVFLQYYIAHMINEITGDKVMHFSRKIDDTTNKLSFTKSQ